MNTIYRYYILYTRIQYFYHIHVTHRDSHISHTYTFHMHANHTNADYNTPHTHIYMPHICYTHKLRCCMPHICKHTLHTTLIHMPPTNIDVTCHINTSHTPHTRPIPHYTPSLTDAHTTSIHTHHIYTPHIYTLCT